LATRILSLREVDFENFSCLQWTEAQRADARNYQAGMVVQFHQNVTGFRRGERVTVTARDECGVSVIREDELELIVKGFKSEREPLEKS
jgi:hypothetical protein